MMDGFAVVVLDVKLRGDGGWDALTQSPMLEMCRSFD